MGDVPAIVRLTDAERAERDERHEQERLDFIAANMARQQARLSRL